MKGEKVGARCRLIAANVNPVAAAVSMALLAPSQAIAESAPKIMIDEVVVTATRRESGLQDVPLNISAIGGDELVARGITDFTSLSKSMPGLTLNDSSPRAGLSNAWIIRGLNNNGLAFNNVPPTQQAPVSTYINDTPVFANLRLKDLERVEVLRGPQGTLYGAGSLGGTLRFIAKRPDFSGFQAEATAGAGQTADSDELNYESDLILNMPLSEKFATRLHVGIEEQGGYIDAIGLYEIDAEGAPVLADPSDLNDSVAQLQPRKEDINNVTTTSARLSARWRPSEAVDVNFSYHYQEQEADGRDLVAYVQAGENGRESAQIIEEPFQSEVDLVSLEIQADLGFATLTSSTSYYDTTAEGVTDYLNLYLDLGIYESIYGASPRPLHRQEGMNANDAFVQELRLVSNTDGAIDWIVGGFYVDQDIELRNEQFFPGYQEYFDACVPVHGIWFTTGETVCGLGTITGIRNGILVTDESTYLSNVFTSYEELSVFGEVTWHATEDFQVTGGLRAFRQEYTTNQQAGLLWTPDEPGNRTDSGDAEDVLFKLNASYDIGESTMIYATVSEGFRRGGINGLPETIAGVPTNPELFDFDPDTVLNRELGIKGTIADRIQYSATLFDMDWEHMQIDASATALILQSVDNIGDASSRGVELEMWAHLTDAWQISAGYSYVDTEVENVDEAPDGLNGLPEVGDPLPGTPEHAANLTIQYFQNLASEMQIDYALTGAYRSELPAPAAAELADETGEALTTWDFAATLQVNKAWSIRAFVTNIFDEQANLVFVPDDYVNTNSTPLFGIPVSDPSPRLLPFNERAWSRITPPRKIGILVTYRFGG